MKYNEHGQRLDPNGYAPSILQEDTEHCFLCGRCDRKLDRHEPMQAAYREKSKADGLWVALCHVPCHEGYAHGDRETREYLCAYTQQEAMYHYGWSVKEWIARYGKNWL